MTAGSSVRRGIISVSVHMSRLFSQDWDKNVSFYRTYVYLRDYHVQGSFLFCFVFYVLADICPFWGHWYPCFGFLVMYPLGFKSRVGYALFAFLWR